MGEEEGDAGLDFYNQFDRRDTFRATVVLILLKLWITVAPRAPPPPSSPRSSIADCPNRGSHELSAAKLSLGKLIISEVDLRLAVCDCSMDRGDLSRL